MSLLPRFRVLLRRVSQGRGMALVKERLIDLSTMGRGMKAIVYLSYAILAATAVLIALHGRLANTRSASAFGIAIPVGVLAASTPVLLLALALVNRCHALPPQVALLGRRICSVLHAGSR
jgi:uncharacterized membrane protein YkvI